MRAACTSLRFDSGDRPAVDAGFERILVSLAGLQGIDGGRTRANAAERDPAAWATDSSWSSKSGVICGTAGAASAPMRANASEALVSLRAVCRQVLRLAGTASLTLGPAHQA